MRIASASWFDSLASLQECRRLGLRPIHARVRPPAVDSRFTPEAQAKPNGRFLFVGNGLPHKNLDVLLDALRMDESLKLDLVGLRPDRRAHYAPRLAALGNRVRVLEGVNDEALVALYREAQALVFPSTAEGFGFPALEAMACGTPAIVADIPVLRETCGEAALFCPPHDPKAWAEAMVAMRDPATRRRWAERGLAWVKPRRAPEGWQAHLEDLESVAGSD
ncbi:MAG: glycosyltransferase family 1 protein [Zetaproteobacteria bacterium]|nr:MAG: glycosyltransferase family 1 protein [Zetaproteobacteria bacterium]